MIPSIYQEMTDTVTPLVEQTGQLVHSAVPGELTMDSLQVWQGIIINLGDVLEKKYKVGPDTEVIRLLERICESIYRLSDGKKDSDVESGILEIEDMLGDFSAALQSSVAVEDKKLAVVAIMYNEGRYLEEWIAYHRIVGVDHFYLYDNGSDDNTRELLISYEKKGIVTLIDYPGEKVQLQAYNHAISVFGNDVEYMAFIDVDEFIVPTEAGRTVPNVIDEIIEEEKEHVPRIMEVGGVGVNWLLFGTAFHKTPTEGFLTEDYLYRATERFRVNGLLKVICNPRVVDGFNNTPHNVSYKSGFSAISERGSYLFNSPVFHDASYEKLRIHHYYSRSEEECLYKVCKRGWPDKEHIEIDRDDPMVERVLKLINEDYNKVYDDRMLFYSDEIRRRIKEIHS